MKVIASKGLRCPMEGNPKKYITDNSAVDVPDTGYYRRLIADGSLKAAEEPVKAAKPFIDTSTPGSAKTEGGKKK